MNLRQVAVLLGATGGVVGEVRRALIGLERNRRTSASGLLPLVLLVGTGVAIGAIAARPELRRRIGEWLIGKQPSSQTETAAAAGPRAEAPPQPYANGA